jgi:TonB family protein
VRDNISTESFSFAMADSTSLSPAAGNTSAGHLSVHFEGYHPEDVPFLFEQQQKRIGPAAMASFVYHLAMVGVIFFAIRYGSSTPAQVVAATPDKLNTQIIWLNQPGPGGGGGGGGNKMKEPPRKAELPGKDAITVPVQKAPSMQLAKKEPDPVEQLNIPAKTMASAAESLPGALDAPPGPPTLSQGSGSGGGSGTGTGTGIGSGTGSGLGPGIGGGTGGGVYRPGNGITLPQLIREVKPQYTSDAMRAKIQGTVWVECVVRQDGTVGDAHVIRSLDSTFGLDEAALAAARQWRFHPGTRMGEPVSVLITIELTFTLR